jgi:hypothetical protein
MSSVYPSNVSTIFVPDVIEHDDKISEYSDLLKTAYPRSVSWRGLEVEQMSKDRREGHAAMHDEVTELAEAQRPIPEGKDLYPVAEIDPASGKDPNPVSRKASAKFLSALLALPAAVIIAAIVTGINDLFFIGIVIGIPFLLLASSGSTRIRGSKASFYHYPGYATSQWSAEKQDEAIDRLHNDWYSVPVEAQWVDDTHVAVKTLYGGRYWVNYLLYEVR